MSVNLLLAIAAGFLTWAFLEAEGFHLALPLAVLVAFLDLIPLIGLTVGGFSVFAVLLIDGGPGDAIVWLIIFGEVRTHDHGHDRDGVLGALLAIPTAASLGVVVDELVLSGSPRAAGAEPETAK